ncbi:sulfotransferase family 2 domain-containing protein [Hazenella sp. IB182357]|uniref:Sulfotransferase family 2 domain-containing protein n=1 Tax=Polycladospora coralii TaxID=2771432 RepID=A0A926N5Z3_9BACL|nr:sulfotransferase family 2 domain-containing protein [Polycladospora coralii]MBD1371396.1 sulfotransferase family 2 domain-containing protein [Polycladospora coralii]MBS7530364.1 sulfotransferase family 2 domain-containing protein [Polycladospora coralii]
MAKPLLIFSHIPKTGGTTMRRIVDRVVPKQYQFECDQRMRDLKRLMLLPPDKKSNIRLIYGHCLFGVHQLIRRPYTYITMLRHPVDLIISYYHYIRNTHTHRWFHKVKSMSFEEFIHIKSPAQLVHPVNNMQTQYISGMKGTNTPSLAIAKKNIHNHYLFVGTTELYAESIFLLNQKLGWPLYAYTKMNVNKNKSTTPITKNLINIIKQKNAIDCALYAYCKTNLETQIEKLSLSSKNKMQDFVDFHR